MLNFYEKTVLFLAIFAYLPGTRHRSNEFILDDHVAVRTNMDVVNTSRSLFDSLGLIMAHDFWGQELTTIKSHKSYRPMVTMIYHLEYRFYPNLESIASYMRLLNVLLHYAICFGMKVLFADILPEKDFNIGTIAVLLFALHPIHTEVLYSIVGRADLFCALFFITGFHNYLDIVKGNFC